MKCEFKVILTNKISGATAFNLIKIFPAYESALNYAQNFCKNTYRFSIQTIGK